MFESILLPTDGSTCARVAADYASDLAQHYDATVHVLHVVDYRIVQTGPEYDEWEDDAAETVESVADRVESDGVAAERAVRTDVPHNAILSYATEEDIDLVVMGTHGRTGVERYLLGSVTEKVVRRSDTPVLTVRTPDDGDVTFPYTDVLVPTDESRGATAAVSPAVDIAGTYGATLHSLSVVDTRSLGIDVRSTSIADELEREARNAVDAVEERANSASVPKTETVVDYGLPSDFIRTYAETNDIDLVVMGTHGRSGISRYLLGSVAEHLVRTSPVPVMTVRMPEASEEE